MAHALDVSLADLRHRLDASEPSGLASQLEDLDAKIARALDLAIEHGEVAAVKAKLRDLERERESLAREVAQSRIEMPSVDELMRTLRARLENIEATLRADLAAGRLALGALFGDERLRVHRDGRIEGAATIQPDEKLPAPRASTKPGVRMVAGSATPCRGDEIEVPFPLAA